MQDGYNDIELLKAILTSLHSQEVLAPMLWETEKNLSTLLMMAAVRRWMAGSFGIEWAGAAGGGPIANTGSLVIEFPWIYF